MHSNKTSQDGSRARGVIIRSEGNNKKAGGVNKDATGRNNGGQLQNEE